MECVDKTTYCNEKTFKEIGVSCEHEHIKKNCRKFCGLCAGKLSLSANMECVDKTPFCNEKQLKEKGVSCEDTHIKTNCRKFCGLCSGKLLLFG